MQAKNTRYQEIRTLHLLAMSQATSFFKGQIAPCSKSFTALKHQTLLESIEQSHLAWPSSCRTGSCRTCISTLMQGEVRYVMPWPGITLEEKEQGCVLPCVAYPITDVVLKDPFEE